MMQANPQDRLSTTEKSSSGFPLSYLAAAIAVLMLVVGAWWYTSRDTAPEAPPPPQITSPAETVVEDLPPAPDIPRREAQEPLAEVADAPPPTDAEWNAELSASLKDAASNPVFLLLLEPQDLAQRATALIDGLNNGTVLRKFLPLPALSGSFAAVEEDGVIYMNPAGYSRYDTYAAAIESIDAGTMVEIFHSFRPYLESSYAQLGMPPEEFDNVLIRSLDRILATPELSEPIALEQESVMYTYADPQLEGLDSVQKQLLRMGPDNIRKIKAKAEEIRTLLLN